MGGVRRALLWVAGAADWEGVAFIALLMALGLAMIAVTH